MRIYPVNQKKIIVGYRGGILLKIGNIIQFKYGIFDGQCRDDIKRTTF